MKTKLISISCALLMSAYILALSSPAASSGSAVSTQPALKASADTTLKATTPKATATTAPKTAAKSTQPAVAPAKPKVASTKSKAPKGSTQEMIEQKTYYFGPSGSYSGEIELTLPQELTHLDSLKGIPNIETVTMIKSDRGNLATIAPGVFAGLPKLIAIYIRESKLTAITDGTFKNIPSLEELDLRFNFALTTVSPNAFADLKNLKYFQLSHTEITQLDPQLFAQNKKLKLIQLTNNKQLTKLPDTLFTGLTQLETLTLASNALTNISSPLFANLKNLRVLSLSNNKLGDKSIPDDAFKNNPNISPDVTEFMTKRFNIDGNPMSEKEKQRINKIVSTAYTQAHKDIPYGSVQEMIKLNKYKIDKNDRGFSLHIYEGLVHLDTLKNIPQIDTVTDFSAQQQKTLKTIAPGAFSAMPNLRYINILDTQLAKITTAFSNLPKLEILMIQGSPIESIAADALKNLPKLTTLILQVSNVPKITNSMLSDLTNLKELTITGDITSIEPQAFDKLTNLEFCRLSYTQIKTLDPNIFSQNKKLKTIYITDNKNLTTLPETLFAGLKHLEELRLNNNALKTIPAGAFNNLQRLSTLDLRDNKLTTIPTGAFKDCIKLTANSLYLDGNPMSDKEKQRIKAEMQNANHEKTYLSAQPATPTPKASSDSAKPTAGSADTPKNQTSPTKTPAGK